MRYREKQQKYNNSYEFRFFSVTQMQSSHYRQLYYDGKLYNDPCPSTDYGAWQEKYLAAHICRYLPEICRCRHMAINHFVEHLFRVPFFNPDKALQIVFAFEVTLVSTIYYENSLQ